MRPSEPEMSRADIPCVSKVRYGTYRLVLAALALALSAAAFGQQVAPTQQFTVTQQAPQMQPQAGQAQQPVGQTQTAPAAQAHALRISSGDLLELGVFDTPELSGKLRVNEAGEIEVPIAGPVRVTGMTSEEAARAVEDKLRSADILKDPHVSIFIAEYATQGVDVTGEVKSPGIYPLLGSHGLVDLLAAAGGLTPTAGRQVSITHKSDPQHPEMITLDNRPGSVADNVDIQPGDTIVVSRAGVAYVEGDVGHPGGFLIEGNDRLTVLQVVALAAGTTKTSAQDKARLIRKTPNGREEMPVPLKKMMDGKVADIPLEDGDILFVPSSRGKIATYRGMDAAIGLTSGLAIAGKL
jgi:polysaccharide export outer membrane protein